MTFLWGSVCPPVISMSVARSMLGSLGQVSCLALLLMIPGAVATCGSGTRGLRVDGNDIGNATGVASAGECCSICASRHGCHFYTYVASKQLCWLKESGSGHHSEDPTCTSGPAPPSPCTSSQDCNMAGTCDSGQCKCQSGYMGDACQFLALGDSFACGQGGLCIPNTSSWGGSVVQAKDGGWHM